MGHGTVLPGNARARSRSSSRHRRAWKAPTRLQHLVEVIASAASDQDRIADYAREMGLGPINAKYRRFSRGSL